MMDGSIKMINKRSTTDINGGLSVSSFTNIKVQRSYKLRLVIVFIQRISICNTESLISIMSLYMLKLTVDRKSLDKQDKK